MPPLAQRGDGDELVLRRVGLGVVRARAPQVGGRVDEPGAVQHESITQAAGDEEAVEKRLVPPVRGDDGREDEAEEEVPPRVERLLKHDAAVLLQVVD
eukprot:6178726-Pleurochrysis_carterae.AAC.1